jgi:hypothetical protein
MGRLSRGTLQAARWVLSWFIPGIVARRAAADARRQAVRAAACLRIARRETAARQQTAVRLQRTEQELIQARRQIEDLQADIARQTVQIEDLVLWREVETSQKKAQIAANEAKVVRATEHIKLIGDATAE